MVLETMRSLRWKLDQAHVQPGTRNFVNALRAGQTGQKFSLKRSRWPETLLYVLLLVTVIVFVCIVMKFAADFQPPL